MAVLIFSFATPFIIQLFYTGGGKHPWLIISMVFVCQAAQIFFTLIMITLMTALGPREYLSDMNNVN